MRAAWRDRYGGPEIVRVEEVDAPAPVRDEVLVRVHAASVNRADLDGLYPRWQFIRLFSGLRRPRSHRLGIDVAGVVEAVGPEARTFAVGDRVYADLFSHGGGAFADDVCASERALAPIPAEMPFEDAATIPHSAVLAVQGLRLRDGTTPRRGDDVLIDGASGNVGPFAVQVAKHLGARVTATCSAGKMELVRSLGADEVLDYRAVDVMRGDRRFDWILAVDAHSSLLATRRALKPRGVYVALGGAPAWLLSSVVVGPALRLATGRRAGLMLWWKPFGRDDLATVERLYREGRLTPAIDRSFPLEDVGPALRWVDEGRAAGKVLITFDAPGDALQPIPA